MSRSCHPKTVDEKDVIFWECLDEEASGLPIAATGRTLGIGPGIKMAIAEFNKKQRTNKEPATGAALGFHGGKHLHHT